MKKLLLTAMAVLMAIPAINAQETMTEGNTQPAPEPIYTHSWRDNWYIQLGAGAQMPLFEKNPGNSNFDFDKTTAVYEAAVGHWFSPWFGFRFRGQGGRLHWDNTGWNKMSYANFGLDLTWDMFNSIGGVNDKRVFSIIPYLGVGTSYAWDYNNGGNILDNNGNPMDHQWVVNGTFGMEFRFRTSKRVDLYIDARMTATADNINNVAWKTGVDPIFSLTGGLKINLGKEGRHATKYEPYDCSGEIKTLNDRINAMRDELNQKDARLRAAESQLPCPEVKEQPVVEQKAAAEWQPAVRFRINSATVSANDKVTLYDVAKYMNENQDVKAIIKGYADKDTGTEEYNRQLSEKRANAVKDIIVGHGVDESRLSIEGLGDSAQPYSDNNNWNRVVLIEFE